MKFRLHKGSLEDSMQTEVQIENNIDALIRYIKAILYKYNTKVNRKTLHVYHYTYDKRIDWDTYIVILDGYGVVGFTNEKVGK